MRKLVFSAEDIPVRNRAGMSLMEVVVAGALFALTVPLLLNLIPTSFLSLRKAELLQVATSLAIYRLDEAAFLIPPTSSSFQESIVLGNREYRVQREFYSVEPGCWEVLVSCQTDGVAAVRLAGRFRSAEP